MFSGRGPARPASRDVALGVVGLLAGLVAGAASVREPRLGIVLTGGIVVVVLVACRPVLIGLIALLGVYLTQRVGGASTAAGGSGGVSYSDALLVLAAFLAAPALIGRPELRRLWVAAAGLAVYLAGLLPTVFLNASTRGYLEWTHRLVLVGGALLIGAWLVREDVVATALRWLTGITVVVAVLAVLDAVASGFQPASPAGLNKNFVGAQLGITLILLVAYRQVPVPARLRLASIVVIAAGLIASQSRGGMLGAAAGLFVAFALDPRAHTRAARAVATVLAIGFALVVYISVHHELTQSRSVVNNSSLGVRFNVERVTRQIWRTSPWDGVGLKYFNTGGYGQYVAAPNNVVDNELAESGLIGLGGFVVLQGAVVLAGVRRRRGDQFMIASVGCVVGSLLHGMVDIYWTAGTAPLPFLLLGMALARDPMTVRAAGAEPVRLAPPPVSVAAPAPAAASHRRAESPS